MGPLVMVTDGEQRAALAVTRSLGRAGFRIWVSAKSASLAGASRWCSAEHIVPDPLREPKAYASAVAGICAGAGVRVLIPMTDGAAQAILDHRERFTGTCIPLPSAVTFSRVSDKAEVTRVAAEVGLLVPDQVVLSDPRAVEGVRLRFPVVVKPHRSVIEVDGSRRKAGVVHAASVSDLARAVGSLPPEAFPVLVQQRIVGPGVGVFLLLWEGHRLAAFGHRRVREKPPAGGVSVYAESVPVEPELLEGAERLLRAFDWRGVAMVEFKRDAAGAPYLMEVNGRFWGSLQLAIDSGVDFPRLLVDAALGRPVDPVEPYRTGIRVRWWLGDLDHLLIRLRHPPDALALPPGTPGRLRAIWDFAVTHLRPGVRNEVFRLEDLRPALREARQWFRSA